MSRLPEWATLLLIAALSLLAYALLPDGRTQGDLAPLPRPSAGSPR